MTKYFKSHADAYHLYCGRVSPQQAEQAQATADVSLRRLQMLRVAPDETVRWEFGAASREVQADAMGCITIPGLKVSAEPATLCVRKAK